LVRFHLLLSVPPAERRTGGQSGRTWPSWNPLIMVCSPPIAAKPWIISLSIQAVPIQGEMRNPAAHGTDPRTTTVHRSTSVREGPRTATRRSPAAVRVTARRPCRAEPSDHLQPNPAAWLRESTKQRWRPRQIDKAP